MKRNAWKWGCLAMVVFAAAAFARTPERILNQAESSLIVRGHVLVEEDGSVSGWEIEQPDKLPPFVVQLVQQSIPTWRFEPVLIDGQPRSGKASMRLRLVANPLGDGNHRVTLEQGYFGKEAFTHNLWDRGRLRAEEREALEDASHPGTARQAKIEYPAEAAAMGAQGTVYVLVRFGRDGRAQDVVAEQVNLWNWGTEGQMERVRELLAKSAIRGVRRWSFRPPTTGELAARDSWTGRITVDYTLLGRGARREYGRWHTYIPGPRQPVDWFVDDLGEYASPELAAGEGFSPTGQGLKLLTPLQGS
jgi:hypothetical protein